MERIRQLDKAVAERIEALNERFHALSETALLENHRGRKGINLTPWLLDEMGDVMAYLEVDYREFLRLYHQWDDHVAGFGEFDRPRDFYLSWKGEKGRSNLCVNAVNQILPYYPLYLYLQENAPDQPVDWCDFGCGTGAFSFVAARLWSMKTATLYDVPNAAEWYVRSRMAAMKRGRWEWRNVLEEDGAVECCDMLVCLDVLEHLEHASATLHRIRRMLRPGGTLILRAPWGNHPEHIPEAAVDFYTTGGADMLESSFELVHHFGHMHVNGVYTKKA